MNENPPRPRGTSPVPRLSLVDARDTDRFWDLAYPPPAAAPVLSALLDALAEASSVREVAQEIVALAVEFCPPVESASITALRDGTYTTLASTDERALAVDLAQYRTEDGPCVSAATDERMKQVLLPGSVSVGRGPDVEWRALSRGFGFRRVTSLPIPVPAFPAALNLYSLTTADWEAESRDVAESLAVYGADTLAVATRFMPDDA